MKFNLSEITDLIKERRTIKPEMFTARVVHREQVDKMLQNALWAPTHGMTQPWRFKVYLGDSVNDYGKVQAEIYRKITPEGSFNQRKHDKLISRTSLTTALIVVCMQREPNTKIPVQEDLAAVSAAVQNILLTATAYGIGSYWNTGGVTYTDELKAHFGLGEEDQVVGQIYLGYVDGDWPKGQRRPLEYLTDWNE